MARTARVEPGTSKTQAARHSCVAIPGLLAGT
jgi:hypothetical protein